MSLYAEEERSHLQQRDQYATAPLSRSALRRVPLCVDLDGTLIKTDLFWESLLALLKRHPVLGLLRLPFWLLRGRAYLKGELAGRVRLNMATLPYNEAVVDYLRRQRQGGRELVLATASHVRLARQVAAHLNLFDGQVLGTEAVNLKGSAKLKALQERFGTRGYDYVGDSRADLPVWSQANQALVVTDSPSLVDRVQKVSSVEHVFDRHRSRLRLLLKAMRVHQWAKNILVLVPLISSHQILSGTRVAAAFTAFLSFSLCASGVYILNDCLDLEADRHHPTKRSRPFASGDLSIPAGLAAALGCLIASFILSSMLPLAYFFVLALYFLLTSAYSLYLKRLVLVDVIILAQLYTVRVYAGGAAADIVPSHWLLTFSLFMFLSLALMKRFAEIKFKLVSDDDEIGVRGRGYRTTDAEHIASIGSSSGLIAVLVLALYISSKEVLTLYSHPEVLWVICPVMLYWITRAWMLTYRNSMDDDPVVFAVRDRNSYIVALLIAAILLLAR
ncbi:MAG TPA: UbiA family prenyltransferase [Nitrospiraceae bacterium]|nr:UbiA family prenyltransferase [Nitrospiraceae bacterium]